MIARTSTVVAAAALVAGCAHHARPSPDDQIVYCASLDRRADGDACVEPISVETARHREHAAVLHLRGGRVQSTEWQRHLSGTTSRRAYRYDAGVLVRIDDFREDGRLTKTTVLSENGRRRRMLDAWGRQSSKYGEEGNDVLYEVDARGLDVVSKGFDESGHPDVGEHGAVESRVEYDARGHTISVSLFDESGRPTLGRDGWHRRETAWTGVACPAVTTYLDVSGRPTRALSGVAMTRTVCDSWGNRLEIEHLDEHGGKATQTGFGHRWEGKRDELGRLVESRWIALDGVPIVREGRAVSRYTYDAAARVNEVWFLDATGEPEAAGKVARRVFVYDASGHVVERRNLDAKGALARWRGAQAIERHRFDDRGNEVLTRYFDANGLLTRSDRGVASRRRRYDERDQLVEESFFDADGVPSAWNRGYARETYELDARGRTASRKTYDAAGNEVPHRTLEYLSIRFAGTSRDVDRTKEEASRRAAEAYERLRAGAAWESIVLSYSDDRDSARYGGSLGAFSPGAKEWADVVKPTEGLAVGAISEPVAASSAFYIVRRVE